MKQLITFILLAICFPFLPIQAQAPADAITKTQVKSDLYFLASDFLKGRRTGSIGNDIAAEYIATQIQAAGFKPAPGMENYFQTINFETIIPPSEGALKLNNTEYQLGEDLLLITGAAADYKKATAVFAGHGLEADYQGLDVKGKVVFVQGGRPDDNSRQATFEAMTSKKQLAEKMGAVGLIEIYNMNRPWSYFQRYFGRKSMNLPNDESDGSGDKIIYGWIQANREVDDLKQMQDGKKLTVQLSSSGFKKEVNPSHNVVGILEGSDPELKNEYILLSAHFDHVGVGKQGGGTITETDSIFNGARDNGAGTVALLSAARALGQNPPKRSVLYLACTAEEIGLLGSRYFAEHPVVPLNQIVFNLNIDNGGYNDTSIITVVGFGRTGTDDLIRTASERYGLKTINDPSPGQGLFDRSDNVSFARKGIPALTFSLGFTDFDAEIMKYYHQVTDNPDNMDYDYLHKYVQSYARLARLVADDAKRPQWIKGDKYEEAGKALYNKQ